MSKTSYLSTWLFILTFSTISYCQECQPSSNDPPYRFSYEDYIETQYAKDINFNHINKTTLGDTKFINKKLNAKNVLEFPISPSIMDAISKYYQTYVEPYLTSGGCNFPLHGIKGYEFYCLSPPWNSDVQWLQVDSPSAYDSLFPYFEKMGLRDIFSEIIDFDENIIVYAMSYVVRSKAQGHSFHVDFRKTTNVNGFTLLTPIQDNSKIHLAYIDMNNTIQQYQYRKNVGIVFGENFKHGTDILTDNDKLEALFCFSFGTDKMRDWRTIKKTAGLQGRHYMHPKYGFSGVPASKFAYDKQ